MALRLALGSSRSRILRGLLTEAVLISLAAGTVGLLGSTLLLRRLSTWQPFPAAPIHLPVSPDTRVYLLALALVSGFLFGVVPVRQVLRTDPYQIIKAGLVTSSLVAVRGLIRSLHGNLGFETRNTMLAGENLAAAGYRGDQVPEMQKRTIAALEGLPRGSASGVGEQLSTVGIWRGFQGERLQRRDHGFAAAECRDQAENRNSLRGRCDA